MTLQKMEISYRRRISINFDLKNLKREILLLYSRRHDIGNFLRGEKILGKNRLIFMMCKVGFGKIMYLTIFYLVQYKIGKEIKLV